MATSADIQPAIMACKDATAPTRVSVVQPKRHHILDLISTFIGSPRDALAHIQHNGKNEVNNKDLDDIYKELRPNNLYVTAGELSRHKDTSLDTFVTRTQQQGYRIWCISDQVTVIHGNADSDAHKPHPSPKEKLRENTFIRSKNDQRYLIGLPLGRGGMGTVHDAYDIKLQREFAAKVVPLDSFIPQGLTRNDVFNLFERTAQASGKYHLRGKYFRLVDVYDFLAAWAPNQKGGVEPVAVVCMEKIPDQSLEHAIAQKAITPDTTMTIVEGLTEFLDAGAREDIYHRDIKPGNLFLDGNILVVSDLDTSSRVLLEIQATTPEYAASEILRGGEITLQSELYSAAVIVYETLTGFRPKKTSVVSNSMLLDNHRGKFTIERLNDFFTKALADNPERRYQTGKEFREAFKTCILPASS